MGAGKWEHLTFLKLVNEWVESGAEETLLKWWGLSRVETEGSARVERHRLKGGDCSGHGLGQYRRSVLRSNPVLGPEGTSDSETGLRVSQTPLWSIKRIYSQIKEIKEVKHTSPRRRPTPHILPGTGEPERTPTYLEG